MTSAASLRERWLARLHSTAPADRPRAEEAVRRLYLGAGRAAPRRILWYDSPFAASWAVAILASPHHALWAQTLASAARSHEDRDQLDRARAELARRMGEGSPADGGAPLAMRLLHPPAMVLPLQQALVGARFALSDDVGAMFGVPGDDDPLFRAEKFFWGGNHGALRSALHCPVTDGLIGSSFAEDYPFWSMAADQERAGEREVPAVLRAAWEVADSAGMWWPFEHVAVVAERPAELRLDERRLLHCGDGPAAVFRDGHRVYAWRGIAVPRRWIEEPERVPARELKGFDAELRKLMETRGRERGAASPSRSRAKPSAILAVELPVEHAARLATLRAHAGGSLPHLDRYLAGAHEETWRELMALGPAVRSDPHAADALAVAYETMHRAASNVRTLVARLRAMGHAFAAGDAGAHVPPDARVRRAVARLEKEGGTLPLSVRAFIEVVGEVTLVGDHPRVAPRDGEVATDPMVVHGVDDLIASIEDDNDDGRSAIVISPDDLHKAGTSGGDPYTVAIPDPRADGELLGERHSLLFVEWLRLCFRFGGFPGWEGVATVPPEIDALREGLLEL